MDDFCGFTYKGVHSSELGLVRVSDGSRYFHNLTASFRDKTMEIPGGDGIYFFESLYNSNSFCINVAFDSVTEHQMRKIREVFNGKDTGELIFDEAPYKAYIVKVQASPQIKYICFMEGGQRIYKGEMAINFISYYPYAICSKKNFDQYSIVEYPNKNEWFFSAKLLRTVNLSNIDVVGANETMLYNPGDAPTDIKVFFNSSDLSASGLRLILASRHESAGNYGEIYIEPITLINDHDTYICINSKTNLIEGYTDLPDFGGEQTESIYNKHIKAGDFFKVPNNHSLFDAIYLQEGNTVDALLTLPILKSFKYYPNSGSDPIIEDIKYNYLYY